MRLRLRPNFDVEFGRLGFGRRLGAWWLRDFRRVARLASQQHHPPRTVELGRMAQQYGAKLRACRGRQSQKFLTPCDKEVRTWTAPDRHHRQGARAVISDVIVERTHVADTMSSHDVHRLVSEWLQ